MNLNHYYANNKDQINSSIMEIVSDLAVGRMVDKYKQPFEAFVEPDDPDDPDSGTHYKEEFQDEYNQFYDEEYERVASLMRFDIGENDGIRKEGNATIRSLTRVPCERMAERSRERIIETFQQHGGHVTYTPEDEDGEYPVAALMYAKHDFPRIDITDVYFEEETCIMADGIDTDGGKRTGFQIYDEQLYDIALFLKYVL